MSTITRVQAQKIIEAADAVITALAGTNEDVHPESDNMLRLWDDLNDRYAPPEVVRELALIALASLETEPVAYADPQAFRNFKTGSARREWMWRNPGEDLIPLYIAPPAPVSVPDQWNKSLQEMVDAMRQYEMDIDEDAPHKHRAMMRRAEELLANRAAMLQGTDENSSVCPDGLNIRAVAALREAVRNQWLKSDEFAEKIYWKNMHDIANEIVVAMLAAAPQQEVKQ